MSTLLLRTTPADGVSARDYIPGGFQWPMKIGAVVTAPDWDPNPQCGGGLHGLPWGEGRGDLLDWSPDALWWVVEAEEIVMIGGDKAKAPAVTIRYVGDQFGATTYLLLNGGAGRAVVGATVSAGKYGKATAGFNGTASAGDYGKATAGHKGTATAGKYGKATAGKYGKATAGFNGKATAGKYGTASAGFNGKATAGDYGTATAGKYGKATAGDYGTASAGFNGKATAGHKGTATAGVGGTLILSWWDGSRRRTRVLYVGEEGIEPNTFYRLDETGNPGATAGVERITSLQRYSLTSTFGGTRQFEEEE